MMAEEIRQTDALGDAEKQRLFGWGENIFGVEAHKLSWRPKDVHFLLYSDGEPVSHVGILKHAVTVDREPVLVGGVGGVVTVPEAQRKGFAYRLMRHTARFLENEWKVDAGLLFCRPKLLPYYGTLGWLAIESPVFIEQPSGKITSPMRVMIMSFRARGWPSGSIKLDSLPW